MFEFCGLQGGGGGGGGGGCNVMGAASMKCSNGVWSSQHTINYILNTHKLPRHPQHGMQIERPHKNTHTLHCTHTALYTHCIVHTLHCTHTHTSKHTQQLETHTDLFIVLKEVIVEASERLEQVGLDTPGGLHSHLGAILQDGHRELWTGHAGQPHAEVPVDLVWEGCGGVWDKVGGVWDEVGRVLEEVWEGKSSVDRTTVCM